MDIVLGVSMAPASIQMVVLEGEYADGATVEEDVIDVAASDAAATTSASDRVLAAILGTREGAADAGLELSSIGVTWTDQLEAAALHDALAAHRIENVMLVSAFLAATALAQNVGGAMGYERTAVMFVEPDTATLAVVETSDGSIPDIYKQPLYAESYDQAAAQLGGMIAGLEKLESAPDGVLVVGSGVDVAPLKPALQTATSLEVSVPEEPETALARGAALASANAPLFASSTAALAYAQDPGTGAVDQHSLPEYLYVPFGPEPGDDELAYSAVPDEDADSPTVVIEKLFMPEEGQPRRRPALLIGSGLAVAGISAVLALEIALAIGIRSTGTIALQPTPGQHLIVPTQEAPAPVEASAPAEKIGVPAPMAAPRPITPPVAAPLPAAPAPPIPAAPAPPIPAAPVPAAPVVPVPVVVPPIAPVILPPVRVPVPNPVVSPPVIQAPPRLSPPQPVMPKPPVHAPQPPQVGGTGPQSPPQAPPGQGSSPIPDRPGGSNGGHGQLPGSGTGGSSGGHVPPPGSGAGGSSGGHVPPPGSGAGGSSGGHVPPPGSGTGGSSGGHVPPPGSGTGGSSGGHVPPPGSGTGGSSGGHVPPAGTGPGGLGGGHASPPGAGSGGLGGGHASPPGAGSGGLGGGHLPSPGSGGGAPTGPSGPFGGGGPLGGGHGGGPIGGGAPGGPFGGGGPLGGGHGGGPIGGGPIGGGGGFGGGHSGGGLGGGGLGGGGGHSGGGFGGGGGGFGGGHSGGGGGGGGHH